MEPPHRRIAVGVVGAGTITREHLAFLSGSARTHVAAVADLSSASAAYAAERWGADHWYTSHAALLEHSRPQVVHVLTPPATHPRIVSDALHAGAHVICEKPLATSHDQLDELLGLARSRGLWLLEDQNYRWNDPVQQLLALVSAGRLGRVRDVEVRMALGIRDGGPFADPHLRSPAHDLPAGPIHDLLPHLVYVGLMFAPEVARPDRVSAHWSNHGGDDGLWRTDDLDATLITGATHLRLRCTATTRPESFSVVVRGDAGEAVTDLWQPYLSLRTSRGVGPQLSPVADHLSNGVQLVRSGVRNLAQKLVQHSPYHGLHRFLDLTYAALQDGGEPPLSYRDMSDTARLVDLLLLEENAR